MAGKREKPEDIVLKLRQVEVLQGQGKSVSEAVRQIGVTIQTYYRWRKEYGGMSRVQLKRLKERWSREFGPVVKVDRMKKVMIQNDKKKEPFARFQSQGCA